MLPEPIRRVSGALPAAVLARIRPHHVLLRREMVGHGLAPRWTLFLLLAWGLRRSLRGRGARFERLLGLVADRRGWRSCRSRLRGARRRLALRDGEELREPLVHLRALHDDARKLGSDLAQLLLEPRVLDPERLELRRIGPESRHLLLFGVRHKGRGSWKIPAVDPQSPAGARYAGGRRYHRLRAAVKSMPASSEVSVDASTRTWFAPAGMSGSWNEPRSRRL